MTLEQWDFSSFQNNEVFERIRYICKVNMVKWHFYFKLYERSGLYTGIRNLNILYVFFLTVIFEF